MRNHVLSIGVLFGTALVLPVGAWALDCGLETDGCTVNFVAGQPCIGTEGNDVIEGTAGNVTCLRAMRSASTNPQLHFHEVRGADHFNILAPVTALVADKMKQDTGADPNLQFTAGELQQRF